jgi:fumarate hydratase class II
MTDIRKETDSLGEVDVPADKLWGAQTQRSLGRAASFWRWFSPTMACSWSQGFSCGE